MKKLFLALGFLLFAGSVRAEFEYTFNRNQIQVSPAESMNAQGEYFISITTKSCASGTTTWFFVDLTTATKNMYVSYEVSGSSGAFDCSIYANTIFTSTGTLSDTSTLNRIQTRIPDTSRHVYKPNGVELTVGTLLDYILIGRYNGMYRNDVTLILNQGKTYKIVCKNLESYPQIIEIRIQWFEK